MQQHKMLLIYGKHTKGIAKQHTQALHPTPKNLYG